MVFGFLIDWVSSRYHQQIWAGVDRFCRDHGINLVTLVSGRPGSPFRWEQMRNQLLEFLGSREFDGFLFMTATLGNQMAKDQLSLLRQKVAPAPVISLGEGLSDVPTVLVNNREGFQAVLDHLYDHHGIRKFAFAGGPATSADARERHRLFFDFLEVHGLETDEERILTGEFSSAWGYQAVARLVESGKPGFEALVCANDDIAMGAMEALTERGFQVPEDVVVTRFDDVATAGPAALTTARQQLSEVGWAGAELLWKSVLGQEVPATTVTKTTLVIRQTCGCLSPGSRAAEVDPRSAYPLRVPGPGSRKAAGTPGRVDRRRTLARPGPAVCGGLCGGMGAKRHETVSPGIPDADGRVGEPLPLRLSLPPVGPAAVGPSGHRTGNPQGLYRDRHPPGPDPGLGGSPHPGHPAGDPPVPPPGPTVRPQLPAPVLPLL